MAARFAILGTKRNIVTCRCGNAEGPFCCATHSVTVAIMLGRTNLCGEASRTRSANECVRPFLFHNSYSRN